MTDPDRRDAVSPARAGGVAHAQTPKESTVQHDILRPSVRATYDSQQTGPRYWVTSTIDGRPIFFQEPIPDPFVRHTVRVGWLDLLRALLRRRLVVEVTVGGDPDLMNDVLELDDQTLIPGRTRHAAWHQSMHQKLRNLS